MIKSEDGEYLFTDTPESITPTREELESYINYEREHNTGYGVDRIAELYIRERDTRRQFSPGQVCLIRNRLWSDMGIDIGHDQAASEAINFILAEFRKLINEP